jgi:hypothetical protein
MGKSGVSGSDHSPSLMKVGVALLVLLAHHLRQDAELGLGRRVIAQGEEVVPLRRRDDRRVPHEGLQEPIRTALVEPQIVERASSTHSIVASDRPDLPRRLRQRPSSNSSPTPMPLTRLLNVSGTNGWSSTRWMCFSVGMARELAELRESILCVFSSARMKRGKVSSNVVRRELEVLAM